MIRHLDDSKSADGYQRRGVAVHKGDARLAGPGRVEVGGESLETDRIIVATGSDTRLPPIEGLEEAGYWTNREATTLSELPESVVILGGGPVGIELGQFLRHLGSEVTIVEASDRLIPREDPGVGELIERRLRADGIDVRLEAKATAACCSSHSRT